MLAPVLHAGMVLHAGACVAGWRGVACWRRDAGWRLCCMLALCCSWRLCCWLAPEGTPILKAHSTRVLLLLLLPLPALHWLRPQCFGSGGTSFAKPA